MAGRKRISIFAVAAIAALITVGLFAAPEPGATREVSGSGPDVTVHSLPSVRHHGDVAGVHSYSVGTTSCNIGDEPLWWCNDFGDPYCEVNQHPVIAQNLYRLHDGRFEQLGMSWLKHGFLALANSDSECGDGSCESPPHGGDQLGVGCTDPYSAGLNGSRYLGLRSEVNAATGEFPYPYTEVPFSGAIDQRIQVEESDLDPLVNPGARYWVEGHYIAADDHEAGNSANNASYREVAVQSNYDLSTFGDTIRKVPAIWAWQAADPEVQTFNLDDSRGERFTAARRVSIARGNAHFEYAIHNLNSDRSANRFTVTFPESTTITNVGFRDVDHHSGEPYATTDWTIEVTGDSVTWYADDFATDPNANALRWSTMFSFWFDATVNDPGDGMVHTLTLFKPGEPEELDIPFTGDANVLFFDGFESGDTSAWD